MWPHSETRAKAAERVMHLHGADVGRYVSNNVMQQSASHELQNRSDIQLMHVKKQDAKQRQMYLSCNFLSRIHLASMSRPADTQ